MNVVGGVVGGGVEWGGRVNHFPKQFSQVALLFKKQSSKNGGHGIH